MQEKPYNQISQSDIDRYFLTGPGEDLVPKTLLQMSKIPGFIKIFGPYRENSDKQSWANYPKHDWSIRELPAINVFESKEETKDSDAAFLNGTVSFQIFWPGNFRRSDFRQVEAAFKGAMENFFNSSYVGTMLDELYWIQREEKVYGLNAYGKTLTWTPNTEGNIDNTVVPVTILDVAYKIDLRAWKRALEFMNRTVDEPFKETLADLMVIGGLDSVYQGLNNRDEINIEIPDKIEVNNS